MPGPEAVPAPPPPVEPAPPMAEMPTAFFPSSDQVEATGPVVETATPIDPGEQSAHEVAECPGTEAETAEPVSPPVVKRVFEATAMGCPNCGEMITPETEVCPNCGKVLREPPPPPILAAFLDIKEGPNEGQQFKMDEPITIIGRDADQCNFSIDHGTISRQHAEITQEDGQYWLQDKGSRNGTYLNGDQLTTGRVKLHEGDEIGIGRKVTLVFNLRPDAPPDKNATQLEL